MAEPRTLADLINGLLLKNPDPKARQLAEELAEKRRKEREAGR